MFSWPHREKMIFLDFSGSSTQIKSEQNMVSTINITYWLLILTSLTLLTQQSPPHMWVFASLWVSRPLHRLWTSPTHSPLLNELFPSLVHHPWASTCQPCKSFILYGNLVPHFCLAPKGTHPAPSAKVLQVHTPHPHSNCPPYSICERISSTHTLFLLQL